MLCIFAIIESSQNFSYEKLKNLWLILRSYVIVIGRSVLKAATVDGQDAADDPCGQSMAVLRIDDSDYLLN
jgi:hypothetical protein